MQHQQAIESFSAALESEPGYVDARLGLANALRRSGQLERSLSEYERILKIDSGASRRVSATWQRSSASNDIREARYVVG